MYQSSNRKRFLKLNEFYGDVIKTRKFEKKTVLVYVNVYMHNLLVTILGNRAGSIFAALSCV